MTIRLLILFGAILVLTGWGGCPSRAETITKLAEEKAGASIFVWMAAMSVLGMGACVAAAVFLPLKKVWGALGCGFAAVLGMSLAVESIRPYMAWVALAVGLLAVGAAIVYFRKYVLTATAAVDFGCAMTEAKDDAAAEIVKAEHATKQLKMGVKGLIDKTIAKVTNAPA